MTICIHDLTTEACGYCRPRRRPQAATIVFISPQRVGHLDGCTHKDDDDWASWGESNRPGDWQNLCNGNAITSNAGAAAGIVAQRACQTCVESERNG